MSNIKIGRFEVLGMAPEQTSDVSIYEVACTDCDSVRYMSRTKAEELSKQPCNCTEIDNILDNAEHLTEDQASSIFGRPKAELKEIATRNGAEFVVIGETKASLGMFMLNMFPAYYKVHNWGE